MAAGLGLVNLVLNYENQACSSVNIYTFLRDKGSYSRHCVAVNELHSHHKMNLLLLQVEKYNLQSQSSFLALLVSTYQRRRLLWVRESSFCLELGSGTDLQPAGCLLLAATALVPLKLWP